MDFSGFIASLQNPGPPANLPELAEALWYDGKGNWEKAHEIAQAHTLPDYCRLHAYLHRKEGDNGNASYWYSRAGKRMPQVSLAKEWESMVKEWI